MRLDFHNFKVAFQFVLDCVDFEGVHHLDDARHEDVVTGEVVGVKFAIGSVSFGVNVEYARLGKSLGIGRGGGGAVATTEDARGIFVGKVSVSLTVM